MKRPRRTKSPRDVTDYEDVAKKIKDVEDYDPEVNVVLYGKPGTGKTTLASTFPKPMLFIDVGEKGTDSVRDVEGCKVIRVADWDELEMLYWYLRDNPDDFKTVCVDTVSQAQGLAIRAVLEKKGKVVETGKLGGWGTMTKKDWGSVAEMLNPYILNMRDLPMNVVFIAHDRVFNANDEDDEAEGIQPSVGPRLMPSICSTLNASVGVIGQTFIRERFISKPNPKNPKKKIEVRKVEYCLRVGPHSYYITKARKPRSVELTDVIADPEYDDIKELIGA